jgi:hypothetical protein
MRGRCARRLLYMIDSHRVRDIGAIRLDHYDLETAPQHRDLDQRGTHLPQRQPRLTRRRTPVRDLGEPLCL